MTRRLIFLSLVIALVVGGVLLGLQMQKPGHPPNLPGAREEVYRSAAGVDLKAWIFEPAGHEARDRRPATVFFFGGGWRGGSPEQFGPQARYLAERGMLGIVVDYRVESRHGTPATAAVGDARAAIRWVRRNANRLGIDPDRIAAGGGSAGGHLAAATGMLPGLDDSGDAAQVSAAPNALVLYNPVLITAPYIDNSGQEYGRFESMAHLLGPDPIAMSPIHHVRPGLPPTLIFHGEDDRAVPYRTAELFAEAMQAAGNRCELVGYPGEEHGFFNPGKNDDSAYRDTTRRMDEFLVSLGWLEWP